MADREAADRQLEAVTEAVRSLAEVMRANGLANIDIEVGDVSIRLNAGGTREVVAASAGTVEVPVLPPATPAAAPSGHVVTAPMIGTFYLSATPGDPPFVRVGEHIDAGQTIGIIEAMKIMNEIPADRSGTVSEILVANAQPVEYGSPLVRISPDEAGG